MAAKLVVWTDCGKDGRKDCHRAVVLVEKLVLKSELK
jgi:hypothetical protein